MLVNTNKRRYFKKSYMKFSVDIILLHLYNLFDNYF